MKSQNSIVEKLKLQLNHWGYLKGEETDYVYRIYTLDGYDTVVCIGEEDSCGYLTSLYNKKRGKELRKNLKELARQKSINIARLDQVCDQLSETELKEALEKQWLTMEQIL